MRHVTECERWQTYSNQPQGLNIPWHIPSLKVWLKDGFAERLGPWRCIWSWRGNFPSKLWFFDFHDLQLHVEPFVFVSRACILWRTLFLKKQPMNFSRWLAPCNVQGCWVVQGSGAWETDGSIYLSRWSRSKRPCRITGILQLSRECSRRFRAWGLKNLIMMRDSHLWKKKQQHKNLANMARAALLSIGWPN